MIDNICIYNMYCNNRNYCLITKIRYISLTFDNDKNCLLIISFMGYCLNNCDNKNFRHFSHEMTVI